MHLCTSAPSVPACCAGFDCLSSGCLAGVFFVVELGLGFHIGFVGTFNSQQRLVMDGPGIARYYILRGNCFSDSLAAVAWVAQVPPSAWLAGLASRSSCTRVLV